MGLSFAGNDAGKGEILEQLFLQYSKLMYSVAYNILHEHHLAEDAVQTAFYKLSKYKFKIDSVSCNKTKAFMVIITRNIALGIYKSAKGSNVSYEENEIDDIPDDKLSPLDLVINNESMIRIREILSSLDQKYSDVILLKYFCDYSISEIALLIDVSEQLIRVRLHRAKKILLKKLKEDSEYEQK